MASGETAEAPRQEALELWRKRPSTSAPCRCWRTSPACAGCAATLPGRRTPLARQQAGRLCPDELLTTAMGAGVQPVCRSIWPSCASWLDEQAALPTTHLDGATLAREAPEKVEALTRPGARFSSAPKAGGSGPDADRRRLCACIWTPGEPGSRRPGQRPRLPHGPATPGDHLPAGGRPHHRRTHPPCTPPNANWLTPCWLAATPAPAWTPMPGCPLPLALPGVVARPGRNPFAAAMPSCVNPIRYSESAGTSKLAMRTTMVVPASQRKTLGAVIRRLPVRIRPIPAAQCLIKRSALPLVRGKGLDGANPGVCNRANGETGSTRRPSARFEDASGGQHRAGAPAAFVRLNAGKGNPGFLL